MPLHDVTCELGAEAGKGAFTITYGGATYRGSTNAKPDAELLVMKLQAAKAKLSCDTGGKGADGKAAEGSGRHPSLDGDNKASKLAKKFVGTLGRRAMAAE
eukprot:5783926-Prymnesium_polylepis.1